MFLQRAAGIAWKAACRKVFTTTSYQAWDQNHAAGSRTIPQSKMKIQSYNILVLLKKEFDYIIIMTSCLHNNS